jgi:hypothetical protein
MSAQAEACLATSASTAHRSMTKIFYVQRCPGRLKGEQAYRVTKRQLQTANFDNVAQSNQNHNYQWELIYSRSHHEPK